MSPERRWLGPFAWHAVLGGLLILVVVPLAIGLDPGRRPMVIRLAAALIVGLMLLDLVRAVRALSEAQPPSTFDAALEPMTTPVLLDPHFVDARDAIRAGAASEIYFSRVLWPRLLDLADRLPGRPVLQPPTRSRARRLFRRGPGVAALRGVIAVLQERA